MPLCYVIITGPKGFDCINRVIAMVVFSGHGLILISLWNEAEKIANIDHNYTKGLTFYFTVSFISKPKSYRSGVLENGVKRVIVLLKVPEPTLNFTNILWAAFVPIYFFWQKFTKPNCK